MALSKSKRFAIFERDGFACMYCGRQPPEIVLEVDHIHPISDGGTDDDANLVTACFDCNRGKSDKVIKSRPVASEESSELRLERIEQMRAMLEIAAQERELIDQENYRLACYWFELRGDSDHMLHERRRVNLRVFQARLPSHSISEAMVIANSRFPVTTANDMQTWKYFCGICWKRIRGE